MTQDLRYGARVLARNPGATAVIVFTLALAIGASTAIFSVVYGVLLRPLPYPKPEQIVAVREVGVKGNLMRVADPNFDDLRSMSHSFSAMAQYGGGEEAVAGGSEPSRTSVEAVSSDFLAALGVQPVMGRAFAAEDQREGAAGVALVSNDYWRQYLGGTRDLSQMPLRIDRELYSVIGVLPAGFHFPVGAGVWVPRGRFGETASRTAHNSFVIGRLREGVTLAQARAELSSIARALKKQYGSDTDMSDATALPLADSMTGRVRTALMVLLGAVGFLLLVACANVTNLLLSQAAARERELAIRSALGARRGRLARQFLIEALLLSGTGGVLGVAAAQLGLGALLALAPASLPRLDEVAINLPVMWFALALSLAVALGLGAVAVARATSGDLRAALVAGGRSEAGGVHSQRFGRFVVATQFALTAVLLVGAGLLGRSLFQVLTVDPGFRTEHIVTMNLALPSPGQTPEGLARQARLIGDLLARLRQIPGVREVGGANTIPLDESRANGTFLELNPQEVPQRMRDLERLFHDHTRTGDADYCVAGAGYFETLGIPLKRGRLFDDRDSAASPHAALISESLAKSRWRDADPLGRTIEFGNMDGDLRLLTVVGIVGDTRESSLEAPPRPTIYVDYRQRPGRTSSFSVVMRTAADAAAPGVSAAARAIVRDLAPDVPPRLSTFAQVYDASLGSRRFNLRLVAFFAATALVLALAGIYGVMSYAVSRRTREIGIRMALGAATGDVLRMVVRQGMAASAAGLAVGIAASVALTQAMKSLLFGVSATDPPTFAVVAAALLLVALAACYVPARRATRVDPAIALRRD